jgi:hypothetical protein
MERLRPEIAVPSVGWDITAAAILVNEGTGNFEINTLPAPTAHLPL